MIILFCHPFSDIDTRRRAACDLVRGLCKFFEGPVTAIFSGYVNSMLAEYAKTPRENWKHKDAAIYLVTSLASKAQTQKVWLTYTLQSYWIWCISYVTAKTFVLNVKSFILSKQHGITQANELVNLTEFFVNHILPDLKSSNGKKTANTSHLNVPMPVRYSSFFTFIPL